MKLLNFQESERILDNNKKSSTKSKRISKNLLLKIKDIQILNVMDIGMEEEN